MVVVDDCLPAGGGTKEAVAQADEKEHQVEVEEARGLQMMRMMPAGGGTKEADAQADEKGHQVEVEEARGLQMMRMMIQVFKLGPW